MFKIEGLEDAMGYENRNETGKQLCYFQVADSVRISNVKLFVMVGTVQWRDSSDEIRTTDMELGPSSSLLDYFSCIYSMYLKLPCIEPSVAICVPKPSKPCAPPSFGKTRDRILTAETLHSTDPSD